LLLLRGSYKACIPPRLQTSDAAISIITYANKSAHAGAQDSGTAGIVETRSGDTTGVVSNPAGRRGVSIGGVGAGVGVGGGIGAGAVKEAASEGYIRAGGPAVVGRGGGASGGMSNTQLAGEPHFQMHWSSPCSRNAIVQMHECTVCTAHMYTQAHARAFTFFD